MLIYSSKSSPRLSYILDFIFNQLLGVDYFITTKTDEFSSYTGPKIDYSRQQLGETSIWIKNTELLFETDIKPQQLHVDTTSLHPVLFANRENGPQAGEYPFDIFAATFYLVTRYEEYLPHQKDMYGRYAHTNSIAFKLSFLNIPLVNIWVNKFAQHIKKKFPSFKSSPPLFSFQPTYDIDIAYAYQAKGFWRNAGGVVKTLLRRQVADAFTGVRSMTGKNEDPFDVYDELDTVHDQYNLKPLYFFLVATRNGIYDKNILPDKPALQQLISRTSLKYKIGLHPSWQSGDNERLLRQEKQVLENLSQQQISFSRQHYIRFNLPEGYRRLINLGITDDYSMGYGSINGFRASVVSTHYWFDLENNEQTSLHIHPFCYMDANSLYEQKLKPSEALDEMMHYYNVCKDVDGRMITVWHNHIMGRLNIYRGWKEVYVEFLRSAAQ